MQPLRLTLKGFRGIRDGLGRDEITLDLERLADGANLIAIVGANGSGKSTIMDCLTPFMGLPSRVALAGAGGFSYYDHVYLPESVGQRKMPLLLEPRKERCLQLKAQRSQTLGARP